jgi:hypothetical protein
MAEPPSATARSFAKRSSSAVATSSSSASAARVAATDAERPSRLACGGATEATPGWLCSCARTSAARAGSSTSATIPGEACAPVACSIRASARAEPESPAVNPPSDCSDPATGPPTTPAKTTKSATASSVRFGRAISTDNMRQLLGRSG